MEYASSQEAAAKMMQEAKTKFKCYGTIVYKPEACVVDFGKEVWPSPYEKSKVCSRMLLVSNWTDARFSLIGGEAEKDETPIDALNREFEEEMGSKGMFTEADYLFTVKITPRVCHHIYGRVTNDLKLFEGLLTSFHTQSGRKAYTEEVVACTGLPIWIEGPEDVTKVGWGNGIWGLPKMLSSGGSFKVQGKDNRDRELLVLTLFKLGTLDLPLMERTFALACLFSEEKSQEEADRPCRVPGGKITTLSTFAEFSAVPGVSALLAEGCVVTDRANSLKADANSNAKTNLAVAFTEMGAAEQLRHLADECDRLHVLQKDVYGDGAAWLVEFEKSMADLCMKEAALYVPSGTMAQQIALCVHREMRENAQKGEDMATQEMVKKRKAEVVLEEDPFLAHCTSHLLLHEQDSYKHLLRAPVISAGARDRPLSLQDVETAMSLPSSTAAATPFALVLEVPHREVGGALTSVGDVQAMRRVCDEHGMKMHCDGARLFEALGGPLGAQGSRELLLQSFHSVYVSFYKGLGGMTGAMLAGEKEFVVRCRVWLRRFGGNLYNNLPYALSGLSAVDRMQGSFEARFRALQRYTAVISELAKGEDVDGGGGGGGGAGAGAAGALVGGVTAVRFWPSEPTCCMIHVHCRGESAQVQAAMMEAEAESGVKVCPRLRGASYLPGCEHWSYFEWNVGPANDAVSDEDVRRGWRPLLARLQKLALPAP